MPLDVIRVVDINVMGTKFMIQVRKGNTILYDGLSILQSKVTCYFRHQTSDNGVIDTSRMACYIQVINK